MFINYLIILFGRKTTLRMNPDHIPDLHWKLAYHTTSIGHTEMLSTTVSIHYVIVETLSYTKVINVENGAEQF